MKRFSLAALAAVLLSLAACDLKFLSPTQTVDIDDHSGATPTPTPSPTPDPTPTPVPCFPVGAPCGANVECCDLRCIESVCQ